MRRHNENISQIDENDIITDCKFETFGCASAIATSSMATELIKGKPVSEALSLTNSAVVEALDGLPPAKIHCSVLAEEAVKMAILDYYKKTGRDTSKLEQMCTGCCSSCSAHEHEHGASEED